MQTRQSNLEGTGEVKLRRLVKEALRMRPSRIIVGEVRQEECLDLLDRAELGLPGMCTIHANSAREASRRCARCRLLAGDNVGHAFVVPDRGEQRRPRRTHAHRQHADTGGSARLSPCPGRVEGTGDASVIEIEDVFVTREDATGSCRRVPAALGAFRGRRFRLARAAGARNATTTCGPAEMGAFLGLLCGVGIVLVWRSGSRRPPKRNRHASLAPTAHGGDSRPGGHRVGDSDPVARVVGRARGRCLLVCCRDIARLHDRVRVRDIRCARSGIAGALPAA